MSQLDTIFAGFKRTLGTPAPRKELKVESMAMVAPGLWEIGRCVDNGYEHALVYKRGQLFHYQYNFHQSGVKNMPLMAIIHAQARVIASGDDAQTIRNDLEGLNILARKIIPMLDLKDQGVAQEWADRKFEDPLEAADELYHKNMLMMPDTINKWESDNGVVIEQRILWGISAVAFTLRCMSGNGEDKIEFNRKYDFLTDYFPLMQNEVSAFNILLMHMGWIEAKPFEEAIDYDRLRKERFARNFPNNRQQNVEHSILTSDCRTDVPAPQDMPDLPPAMQDLIKEADDVNVEDAYPKTYELKEISENTVLGGMEQLQTRRDVLAALGELEARTDISDSERNEKMAALYEQLERM